MLTGDILRQSARRHPDRTALICGDRRIAYGALAAAANRFAQAVLALGIGRGDTVAVMSRNAPEYVIAHFGTAQTGAILVNAMPAYAPDELVAILTRTAAKLLVVEAAYQEKIAAVIDRLLALAHVVVIGEPGTDGWLPFDRFIAGRPETPPDTGLSEADPFAMTFTGGTTGLPKGALVSHRARLASVHTTAAAHEVIDSDVIGLITPFYHAMGSLVWLPTAMHVGATCVVLTGWDPDALAEETARHGISNIFLVPVQLRELLSEAHFDARKLASLRRVACGGAITPADLVAEAGEKLPHAPFTNHYGQSETGPICIYGRGDPRDKAHTVGKPPPGVEFTLLDEAGNPVATGETGEIVVRGDFLMEGYYDDPEETAAYFRTGDGRGWTGDLATMDEDGFVTLVGRSKDMIVSGGVNIYPREVELALEKHAAIVDCAVFGVPDEKWGEALVAYVVLDSHDRPSEDDIVAHCTQHLARFKRPKVVRFVDAIPKTPSGKVQKPKLREAFLKENAVSR